MLGAVLFVATLAPRALQFPYQGPQFERFVARSYSTIGKVHRGEFYQWMDQALRAKQGRDWAGLLASHRGSLRTTDAARKSQAELELGADLHKSLKKTITKFSLDRGFEFCNTVSLCERQCFLQSIIIAGMLQKVGVPAGIAMVWSNPKGQETNLSHACVVMKLADGRDAIVDASDPEPNIPHQGLFAYVKSRKSYRFLRPNYDAGANIKSYRDAADPLTYRPADVEGGDIPFLVSQFDYYRGERALGGILAKPTSPAGLAASARLFRSALDECPQNPLPLSMLARTLKVQGHAAEATQAYVKANQLYGSYGWVPPEVSRGVKP